MRRLLIRFVFPALFCILPVLATAVVVYSLPGAALEFFLKNISPMDSLILGLGAALFVMQTILAWKALSWRGDGFDEGADRWITHLAQAAEWFPILGLLGTVIFLAGAIVIRRMRIGKVSPQVQTALAAHADKVYIEEV